MRDDEPCRVSAAMWVSPSGQAHPPFQNCLGRAGICASISYLPGAWTPGTDVGHRPVPLPSPRQPSRGDSGTPDTRCSLHCKQAVVAQNRAGKLSPVHLQPGRSEAVPSLKAKGDGTCPNVSSQNQTAPSSSRLAPINHSWPLDKMAISCLRK